MGTSLSLSKCALFLHFYLYRSVPLGTVYRHCDRGESADLWEATNWFRHMAASFVITGSAVVVARSSLGNLTKCSLWELECEESYVSWGILSGEHRSRAPGRARERVGLHPLEESELIELVFWIFQEWAAGS